MLVIAAALAQSPTATPTPLEPLGDAIVLDREQPVWSRTAHFAGGSMVVDLDWSAGALDPSTVLFVAVDDQIRAEVRAWNTLGGTPGTPGTGTARLTFDVAPGRHTLSLRSRLREAGHDDCDPGEPWLRVESKSTLTGLRASQRPSPARVPAMLAGLDGHLHGGSDVLWLEAATLLHRWGSDLTGDAFTVELVDSDLERSLDWVDDTLVITGDPAFVRVLHTPDVLARCPGWPCRFPTTPLDFERPRPGTTLADLGLAIQTLRGRDERTWVLPVDVPLADPVLRLQVRRTAQTLDPESTVTVALDGVPLGTWSIDRLDEESVLEVPLPASAARAHHHVVTVRSDLRTFTQDCEREAETPWVTVLPDSGITGRPLPAGVWTGLADAARRIRHVDTATICFDDLDVPVTPAVLPALVELRPRGGWAEDCEMPDVTVSSAPPVADGQAIPLGLPLAVSTAPLTLHIQDPHASTAVLPWFLHDASLSVPTKDGWSGFGLVW